jgi:hypothetical protein
MIKRTNLYFIVFKNIHAVFAITNRKNMSMAKVYFGSFSFINSTLQKLQTNTTQKLIQVGKIFKEIYTLTIS